MIRFKLIISVRKNVWFHFNENISSHVEFIKLKVGLRSFANSLPVPFDRLKPRSRWQWQMVLVSVLLKCKKSQTLTHSSHPPSIWGPGPPTRHQNGWCLSCISTRPHRHTFLIFSLRLARATRSFGLPSPCGDAVLPPSLMFFTQRASHTVCRLEDPAFNGRDRRIKTAAVLPMRKGWLTRSSYTHHTCRKSLAWLSCILGISWKH